MHSDLELWRCFLIRLMANGVMSHEELKSESPRDIRCVLDFRLGLTSSMAYDIFPTIWREQ